MLLVSTRLTVIINMDVTGQYICCRYFQFFMGDIREVLRFAVISMVDSRMVNTD
jgi:hypothetical protein